MMGTRYQILASGGVFDHEKRQIVPPVKSSAAWRDYQEWLTAGGTPLPPDDTVSTLPLAEAQARRIEEINAWCAGQRNRIVNGRSAGEMASWSMKLLDALARSAGNPSPFAPLMPAVGQALGLPATPAGINDAMGMIRGNGEADYIAKVMRDAGLFIAAEIALDAVRGKHCDAIAAMTDVRDVTTYDWRTGWPDLDAGPTPN